MTNSRQLRSLTLGLSVDAAIGALAVAIVFVLTVVASPAALAQTLKVIYKFSGGQYGGWPFAGVTIDKSGNLYGTTYVYGAKHSGVVYQLKLQAGKWIFTDLYTFTGGKDGGNPRARVIFGPNGTLYGTTQDGGNGYGTVFNLRPPSTCTSGPCPWTETVLYAFKGDPDCAYPGYGDLVFDHAGNIYGTTYNGGTNNRGCVYKLTPSGTGGYSEKVIYRFGGGNDGYYPFAGLILDSAGNLYGTTGQGGHSGYGTVFQLVPASGVYTKNILYNFTGGADGGYVFGGLIFDPSSHLYGSTEGGPPGHPGTAFNLTPEGHGIWSYAALHAFTGGQLCGPYGSLARDGAGNLYGTTDCSGAHNLGNVFKLTPTKTYTSLHDFTGSDGANPLGNVTFDASGNLYGTASGGGNGTCESGCGVVWEITP